MSALLSWFKRRQSDANTVNNPTLRTDRYEYLSESDQNDLPYSRKSNSHLLEGRIDRDWVAFFIFGCINNLIYVVILSAAVDLVGAEIPKGLVLLADITPSLLIKMTAPYFIHRVPYPVRVIFCASLSFSAVILIALAETISVRLVGVMMASLSSGLGELTFLMLSSFYPLRMVSAWSSGTGGAGLLGALLFLALTSWFGLSIPRTLGVVALFPVMMMISYFIILTDPSTQSSRHHAAGYRPVSSSSQIYSSNQDLEEEQLASPIGVHRRHHSESLPSAVSTSKGHGQLQEGSTRADSPMLLRSASALSPSLPSLQDSSAISVTMEPPINQTPPTTTALAPAALPLAPWDTVHWGPSPQSQAEPTSINTLLAATDPDDPSFVPPFTEAEVSDATSNIRRVYKSQPNDAMTLEEKLAMAKSLLMPYMVPLFLVYVAEYTMNQGVLPVILFPLEKTPFTHLRDHYVTYSAIYQLGVFISRSSASLVSIPRLWIPSALQLVTLLVATAQAIFTTATTPAPIPSIYLIFILILWEGLLGGATYVHTYIEISKYLEHDPKGKEFALGVVGVADGLGIMIAGLASLWIEPALCRFQVVERGIELCLAMAD
ncbi:CLN3 protein-domain-containing protein [Gamsiella multidivaricata]|uniref:CLN3 protein-domain-containing protein n=1 Tax=Gamsiella multidivaricata TaxID=101098 RepID=UPI002220C85A|nr:CLN3 protein-domain-containing protein [Gamsiella multidivaricata]KAI7816772.1 CLN3 protein-domain-containing protein [Gamsiella multidivaricata]